MNTEKAMGAQNENGGQSGGPTSPNQVRPEKKGRKRNPESQTPGSTLQRRQSGPNITAIAASPLGEIRVKTPGE